MNANGARTESNNFLVDSSTVSSSQRSGVANITPNPEVVEEVRVAVNNFSAETGRNGSVLVNIVTKSGSNTWHGSASYFYTNDSLQAKNEFQQQVRRFPAPRLRPQGVFLGARRTNPEGPHFLLHLRRRAAIRRRHQSRGSDRDAAVHRLHEAEPAEQRVDVRDEHLPGIVQRRAQFPDGWRSCSDRRAREAARSPRRSGPFRAICQ